MLRKQNRLLQKINLLFGILILWSYVGLGQFTLGQSEVRTFSREQYSAGAQNWAITQDAYQRIYFANNEGLLVYNGQNWQRFPIPNQTILRSIAFGKEGRLYAGAQDELGYFAPDANGRLTYTSLKSLLSEKEKKFPDVWQIEVTPVGTFFRSDKVIFHYYNQQLSPLKAATAWRSLHQHQGNALAHEKSKGLLTWQQNKWQTLIPASELPTDFLITDLVSLNQDSSLLCTEKHGFFVLNGNQLLPFRVSGPNFQENQHFTTLALLQDKTILAGTYLHGLYHLSRSGKVLDNIANRNGLRNNTVRSLFTDSYQNIWVGLDNGIAFFEYRNAIRHINPPSFLNGVGYDVQKQGNELFFALSTGVQYVPILNQADLGQITGAPQPLLNGLSWKLSNLNNQLIACRDDGIYLLKKNLVTPISKSSGYWTTKPLGNGWPGAAVAGNYQGLHFFKIHQDLWVDAGQLPHFQESARFLEVDDNHLWVSHPYRGVYKINAKDKKVTLYRSADGLPSDLNNHVFKIRNQIVFATQQGIYEYNARKDRMQRARWYSEVLGTLPIRYLKEDSEGRIWFVQENLVGVIEMQSAQPKVHYLPELKNKIVSGFENFFPFNKQNIFIGSDEGFYHLNFEQYQQKMRTFQVYLTRIKSIGENDSVLFGGFQTPNKELQGSTTFPYALNSLSFAFAASHLEPFTALEFRYYLEGFDKDWGIWNAKPEKDYTNLPPGTYTFHLKARRSPSHESTLFRYTFIIQPPFYRTYWAYCCYGLMALTLLYALLKVQARKYRKRQEARRIADRQRFEEEQKQLTYQHQIEIEQSEKEFIRLQKEKLEAEISHKNAELASATMNLVQKKEFILKLKAELAQLQKNQQENTENPELRKLLKTLGEEEKLNKEWDHFAQHFNSVHGNFLQIVKRKFPLLKPHEMQLCAYLRMNLSSKEIAPLMSISIRGVEISRYRLRKKLNLTTEENLVQYLLDLKED